MSGDTNQRTTPAPTEGGTRLGPYRLLEALGRGGMATVYLALDDRRVGVHRLVAVKVLHPHLREDLDYTEMFVDEAQIASQIAHPNVCGVLDYGVEREVPFLVMEYVCGETLSKIGRRLAGDGAGGLPGSRRKKMEGAARVAFVARLISDAAAGLQAVHELQAHDGKPLDAVHRDVSPDNILISCSGSAKLIDFGVVKAGGRQHQTEAGLIKGKLSYLAPETLESVEVDRRADVWSLGVIVWELLTGTRLFLKEREVDTLRAIQKMPVLPPSRLRCSLPHAVDEAVMKALERDPDKRYDNTRQLGDALLAASARAGGKLEAGAVQRWLRREFEHDAGCLQRRLLEAGDEVSRSVFIAVDDVETTPPTRANRPSRPTPSAAPERLSWTRPSAVKPAPRPAFRWAGATAAVAALGFIAGDANWPDEAPAARATMSQAAWRAMALGAVASPRPALISASDLRLEIVDAEGRAIISGRISELEDAADALAVGDRSATRRARGPSGPTIRPTARPAQAQWPAALGSPNASAPDDFTSSQGRRATEERKPPKGDGTDSEAPRVNAVSW